MPAIYYSTYPAATPVASNYNYGTGDWYVTNAGSQSKASVGSGINAGKILWAKPAAGPYPRNVNTVIAPFIPELIGTALGTSFSLGLNTLANQGVVEFYGGTAIIPTGGTSATKPGTTPIYTSAIVPALPAGLTLVGTGSIKSANASDGTGPWLHNSVSYAVTGTPTGETEKPKPIKTEAYCGSHR